ncbi:MAG: tetratricopeptide repeat protein [Desulfobacterales bacterium]|nr:tetratricopeptide repeat protein [Desulfobacterales bacterium]
MKKTKKRQKQNHKKIQKQKKRQEKIKKQVLSAREASPPDIEDQVSYAFELWEDGEKKEAEKLLNKLKKKHRNHYYVNYGLGALCGFRGKYDEAIQFFKNAITANPDFAEGHFNLGVAFQKQYNIAEMIVAYRQAVKIGDPDSVYFHHAQKMLHVMEEQVRESDGISLDEYIHGNTIFNQGMEAMYSGDWKRAIGQFRKTIEIVPNQTQSYGNLGICYAKLGKRKEALDAFDKAIELDPNYELALVNRKFVELLDDGECLNKEVASIEYYKDYAMKNRSYINEYLESHNLISSQDNSGE